MATALSVVAGLSFERFATRRAYAAVLQGLVLVFFAFAAYFIRGWVGYMECFAYPYALTFASLVAVAFYLFALSREDQRDVVPMAAFSAMTALVAAFAAAAGLSTVFFAIDELLGADISYKAYQTVWLSAVSSLFVMFFVSYATRKERFESPKVWKALIGYVGLPVYLLLTLVMLVFCVKCAVTMAIPDGQVNFLVIVSSVLWMAFHFLTSAYDAKGYRLFARFGALFVLPQVLLQMIALSIRISAYGFTPARYLSCLFALFAGIFAAGTLFGGAFSKRYVFLLAAFFGVVASYGPLNVIDFSVGSQFAKLDEFKSRKDSGEKFDDKTRYAVMDTWAYTSRYEKRGMRYLPKKTACRYRSMIDSDERSAFEKEWGFKYLDRYARGTGESGFEYRSYRRTGGDIAFDGYQVKGYYRIINVSGSGKVRFADMEGDVDIWPQIKAEFAKNPDPKDIRLDLGDGRKAVVLELEVHLHNGKHGYVSGSALIVERSPGL